MKDFLLVNPIIKGSFPTTFKANSEFDAAKQFWEQLAVDNKYITNNLPKFLFTLQEGGNLYHMLVKEKPSKTGTHTEYTIDKSDTGMDAKQIESFLKESEKVRQSGTSAQKGGKSDKSHRRKRYDDDSSDSDSDSDSDYFDYLKLNRAVKPISYWWYAPTIYRNLSNYTVFTPTFNTPISPYVQLWVPIR